MLLFFSGQNYLFPFNCLICSFCFTVFLQLAASFQQFILFCEVGIDLCIFQLCLITKANIWSLPSTRTSSSSTSSPFDSCTVAEILLSRSSCHMELLGTFNSIDFQLLSNPTCKSVFLCLNPSFYLLLLIWNFMLYNKTYYILLNSAFLHSRPLKKMLYKILNMSNAKLWFILTISVLIKNMGVLLYQSD